MKIKISLFFAALLVMGITGCKKMDDTYKKYVVPEGITYVERAKAVKTYSGLNRVKFTWAAPVDPSVSKARIYWNNFADSAEFKIPGNVDSVTYFLNIPEGMYSFIIKTFDDAGKQSVPVEVQGRSIGATFLSNMFNRPLSESFVDNTNGKLLLTWGGADTYNGSIGHELIYTDATGAIKKVFVTPESAATTLADYKSGTDLSYTTWYRADTTSVDTLKTSPALIPSKAIVYKLDKSKFKAVRLPGDAGEMASIFPTWRIENMWDGRTNADPGYHSPDIVKPAHVTFELGTSDYALYSFRLWQRTDWGSTYSEGNPKTFSLWGSNNPPADGSWTNWTKLGDFTSGTHNVTAGELFLIPPGVQAYRYIRIQVHSTWNPKPTQAIQIMEVELMGNFSKP
ncbi:MAG: hypothetical protein J7599_13830 [Niabella sp.]|nr:hypothetical protein [Niabella sp.]